MVFGMLLVGLIVLYMEIAGKTFLSKTATSYMYRDASHSFKATSSGARVRPGMADRQIPSSNKIGKPGTVRTEMGGGNSMDEDSFLSPPVYVTLSFLSEYPEPVLFVRVEGPGDADHAASWFAPDTCEQLKAPTTGDIRWLGPTKIDSQRSENGMLLTAIHFRVGFRPISPETKHMLHVRLEYKSYASSMLSGWQYRLTNTSGKAFVGKMLEGSPIVVVPKMWAGYAAPPPGPLPLCADPTGAVGKHGVWQVGYSEKNSGTSKTAHDVDVDADPAVKAKCNSNNQPLTSNDMWGRRGCRMQRYDPRCLYDAGGIYIAGDSVSRYMYYQLACELRALGASEFNVSRAVMFTTIDGPLPNYINLQIENVCHNMKEGLSKLKGMKRNDVIKYMQGNGNGATQHSWQTLSINAGGLWQCTFGEDVLWKMYLHKVLDAALDAGFRRVLWISTTAVHPTLYPAMGRKFWPLTNPRVEEVNAYALSVGRARGLEMLDYSLPTSLRETNPMEKHDMRHFGQNTMHELSQILLRATCSSPQHPDVAQSEKAWLKRGERHGRINEEYFKKGTGLQTESRAEIFDEATKKRPCYVFYPQRKIRAYMKSCVSKHTSNATFRGWQCPSMGDNERKKVVTGIVVGRGECLGDPVTFDTCDKIINHGQKLGKHGRDLGFIEPENSVAFKRGDFNHADNQFKLAAGYCKCQPNPLPEWQQGYLQHKTGPFAEIDIENVIAANSKPNLLK